MQKLLQDPASGKRPPGSRLISKICLLTVMLLFSFWNNSEVFGQTAYSCSAIPSSFSSIPGATAYTGFSYGGSQIGPLNLPFSFEFFGQKQTQYYISTWGRIKFPSGYAIVSPADVDILHPANYIKYQVLGTAPNRVMVIEYYSWEYNGLNHFQVKLFETTNVIELHSKTLYNYYTGVGLANGNNIICGVSWASSSYAYRFTPAYPSVLSFSPTSGTTGTSVTITGANFTGATAVRFNGVSAPSFTVNSAGTQITVTVPAGATTGPVQVTTPNGTGTSSSNFTVINPNTITTGTISPINLCLGTPFSVPFTATGTYNSGNIFTAQLSDANGSFASPVAIGTLSSTASGIINANLPAYTTVGTGYRIRVIASGPSFAGANNGSNLAIMSRIADPVASASLATIVQGQSTTLSVTNPSPNATYYWNGPGITNQTGTSIIVTPATSGAKIYTVSAQANAGYCSPVNTGSVTVTVAPPPSPLSLFANQVTAYPGSQVVVPIRVSDFTNILTAQGTVTFNPAVVSFANAEQFAFSDLTSANFGVSQAANGKITFSWDDVDRSGESLPNNAVLFALRFNVTGAAGTVSPIQFTSVPTPLEFTNATLFTLTVNTTNGAVNVVNRTISGIVKSEHNTPINIVTLTATSTTTQTSTTNATGAYSFNVNAGGNYSIVAAKSNEVVANNGVTTLDIALIRRHIMAVQPLASPYKLLAADVDASNTITTADIAQMRSLILATTTSFNGQKWRFVRGNYVLPSNPFPFTAAMSTLSLNNVTISQTVDFIGLKLGDVNNTWDNAIARLQAAGDLYMLLPSKQVQVQDTVEVPVMVKDFTNVSGYQFTMEWDKQVLQYIGVVPAALQGAYGQHQVNNGKLTTTWDEPSGQSLSLADSTVIFKLKFKAIGSAGASSALSITSSLTNAEGYNNQLAPLNLISNAGLVRIGTVSGISDGLNQGYAFNQNYPNPFSANTTFSFSLPKAEKVKLVIYNSVGQEVALHQAAYGSGEHALDLKNILQSKALSPGTYIVTFSAGNFLANRKMIMLKD